MSSAALSASIKTADRILSSSVRIRAPERPTPPDPNKAYEGTNFLGKAKGEKRLQLMLAQKLLKQIYPNHFEPRTFVDFGCGDGWFSRALLSGNMLPKGSVGYLYDTRLSMCHHAAESLTQPKNKGICGNIHIASDIDALREHTEGQADIVFLNMVDICQSSAETTSDLFNDVATCLKPNGHIIVTTQNPMAHGQKFKYYSTEFIYNRHTLFRDNTPLITYVKGVNYPLADYHRQLHTTAGYMMQQNLKPEIIATIDDKEGFSSCILTELTPASAQMDKRDCAIWVPAATDSGKFVLYCLDDRGSVKNHEVPDQEVIEHVIRIDNKAPYMGIAAKKPSLT